MEDKLFELGKNSKRIFTKVSDDYGMVTKKMPVDDQHLKEYISGMRKAREAGINIAEVLDYQMIPDTTSSYDDGKVTYTKGVFLERMAKGKSNDYSSIYISTKDEEDVTEAIKCVNDINCNKNTQIYQSLCWAVRCINEMPNYIMHIPTNEELTTPKMGNLLMPLVSGVNDYSTETEKKLNQLYNSDACSILLGESSENSIRLQPRGT